MKKVNKQKDDLKSERTKKFKTAKKPKQKHTLDKKGNKYPVYKLLEEE